MDEQILAGVIGRDESEALVVVEPLHGSCCHVLSPPGVCALRYAEGAVRATTATRGTAFGRTVDRPFTPRVPVRSGRSSALPALRPADLRTEPVLGLTSGLGPHVYNSELVAVRADDNVRFLACL